MLRLLKQQDLKGLGGVLLEEVQESLPHCEKALKKFVNDIVYITRPIDKKKVLFYNDRSANLMVDEDFQKLWRTATVDAMDDAKIDEYLEKQGANFHVAHTHFHRNFYVFCCFFSFRNSIYARSWTEKTISAETKEIRSETSTIQETT